MRTIKDQKVKFSIKSFKMEDYNDDEFAIAKVDFLSTNENTHKLDISDAVLRDCASSVLGKWLVAEYDKWYEDVTTHTDNQQIFGIVPVNQEVEFREENGVTIASVVVVISKIYSLDLYNLFGDEDTVKDVSVEMLITGEELENGHIDVESFRIVGITVLGKVLGRDVHGSCPDAHMSMIRFSDEDANKFYANHNGSQQILVERRTNMAETKYKINKKELKDTAWGDVDKVEMRNKIMEAENRATLVKSVYMLVEEGWEDAPSEHLKYPVMELVDDTFYYNRYGLASALAYAKQEGEDEVVEKIEKIYDKFDLEKEEEKEEKMAMKEIEFAAVDLNDMWCKLYNAIRDRYDWRFYIDGVYEEDNQKFAIIKDEECNIYRIDYSYTEEGLELEEEYIRVEVEFVPKEETVKFAEPEDAEKYTKFAEEVVEDPAKMVGEKTCEEMLVESVTKCAELEATLQEKENIIMEQDKELEVLRAYKAETEDKEKADKVNSVMADVEKFLSNDMYNEFKNNGLSCKLSELDNWENKVKAFCFTCMAGRDDANLTLRIQTPDTVKETTVWDRL